MIEAQEGTDELNKVRKDLNILKIATRDVLKMREELKRLKETI